MAVLGPQHISSFDLPRVCCAWHAPRDVVCCALHAHIGRSNWLQASFLQSRRVSVFALTLAFAAR